MKKYLSFLVVSSLFLTGGLLSTVGAQTPGKRKSAVKKPAETAKPAPPASKAANVQSIVRARKAGSLAATDPCTTAAPITLNQPIDGILQAGDCALTDGTYIDYYDIHGTAGQAVYLGMTSGSFDTYLYLLDTSGNIVAENDDSNTMTDSRIPVDGGVITLPYTGDYIIGANSYDPSTGNYTVGIYSDPGCTVTPIGYNQPVNGSLATSDCAINIADQPYYTDLYTFNGHAGDQISLLLTSGVFDAYLILHTPSGTGSLEDDDSGGGTDARIPASGTITLPETGTYTIEASSANAFALGTYTIDLEGAATVSTLKPYLDFDGDGKTDLSIFRPNGATGSEWWYQKSSNGDSYATQFGTPTDKIVAADYTGDGKADIAFWRPSTGEWYILRSEDSTFYAFPFGTSGDIPAPGDFDGDGKVDAAVFRPSNSTWYIQNSGGGTTIQALGTTGDQPVVGDFDGDGKADIAVFRPNGASGAEWWIQGSTAGLIATQFGAATDNAVPGDYTGDGKTDIAVWRPSTGEWFVLRSEDNSYYSFVYGAAGDLPVPGDYDGDGKTDAAIFRPADSTWYVLGSTSGTIIQQFGTTGDQPVPNEFVR